MQESTKKNKNKASVILVIALMAGGIAVASVLTFIPWNTAPLQVTENVTVLAINRAWMCCRI